MNIAQCHPQPLSSVSVTSYSHDENRRLRSINFSSSDPAGDLPSGCVAVTLKVTFPQGVWL